MLHGATLGGPPSALTGDASPNHCREAIEAGVPIEGAFSRNRSFRKKLKKYGQYVPRGQTGPQQ